MPLLGARQGAGLCIVNEKGIERDSIVPGEDLRAQDIEPRSAERAGDFAEQASPIPGADFHRVVATIGFIVPIDYRRQGVIFICQNLQAHELMRQYEVSQSFTS